MTSLASLASNIAHFGCIHTHDAERVLAEYRRLGLVRESAHDGVSIKHGAFLEKDIIRHTLEVINDPSHPVRSGMVLS